MLVSVCDPTLDVALKHIRKFLSEFPRAFNKKTVFKLNVQQSEDV